MSAPDMTSLKARNEVLGKKRHGCKSRPLREVEKRGDDSESLGVEVIRLQTRRAEKAEAENDVLRSLFVSGRSFGEERLGREG